MEVQTIGFIGLGNMGSSMARHLARAGYRVIAYDVNALKREAFSAEFSTPLPIKPADLAAADMIITMVPNGAVVRDVLLAGGEASLANKLKPGSIVIDTTSSPPENTRELGALLASRGVSLIDAPVSGGSIGARERKLVFMVGGDEPAAIERAIAVLSHLGPQVFRMGPLGSGHAMKTLNNYVSAAGYLAACEAMAVGKRYGLDPSTLIDVLNVSTGRNFATETSMKRVLAGNFQRFFALNLFTKDIKIAADLADQMNVRAPLAHLVYERMAEACGSIDENGDHTTAYAYWEAQQVR